MAKAMSKTAIISHFAKKFDLKKKDAVAIFEELAGLAYREAKNAFTLPGIGKLVLVNRKARVGRNPNNPAQTVQIPPRAVVKFKAGKVMTARVEKLMPPQA